MKSSFTMLRRKLYLTLGLLASMATFNVTQAQDPLAAGQTYYVNGSGVDLVAPKDTFANLAGAYAGGAYTATTGIINALNVNGIDPNTLGPITILLVPGYTGVETSPVVANTIAFASALRTITIKPSAGVNYNITTSTALASGNAVFRFNGTQFFVIDGEGTPGQRNLSFTVTGTNTGTRIIDLISSATVSINTVTVKNVNLTGGVVGNNVNTQVGVYIGGLASLSNAARRNANITVQNCNIQGVQFGLYARGITASTRNNQDIGLSVLNNTIGGTALIGGAGTAGIFLSNQANTVVRGNTITGTSPTASNFKGIELSNAASTASLDSAITIEGNYIHNLITTSAGSGMIGIRMSLGNHFFPLNIRMLNNVISNISGPGNATLTSFQYPIGILVDDSTMNCGLDIFNNSISLTGSVLNNSSAACLVTGPFTVKGLRVFNNIFSNRMNGIVTGTSSYVISAVLITRNVVNNAVVHPFDSIDNNLYEVSTTSGWAEVGRTNLNSYTTVAEWAAYTGYDANSFTTRPVFENALTLQTSNGAGTFYGTRGRPYVSFDILGNPRPASNISVGAYQFTQNASASFAPLTGGVTYAINGIQNPPVAANPTSGSFSNLTNFVDHLNNFGTQGAGLITVVFENGFLPDSAVVPAIQPYPGMLGARPIKLTVASGVTVNITLPTGRPIAANSGLLRLYGASFFEVDGTDAKAITFSLPTAANSALAKLVIWAPTISNAIQNNTLRNCNLIGNSTTTTTNTIAGIYMGAPYPTTTNGMANALFGPNVGNFIGNNVIEAVRNGIYWSARANQVDQLLTIYRNVIGGTRATGTTLPTTYLGGTATNQAGIYLKGVSQTVVDSNIIRNSINTVTGFRGIDLDVPTTEAAQAAGVSQNIDITRNTIYNLGATSGFAVGIRSALNQGNRGVLIINNIISKIYGTGSNALTTLASPAAIALEPSANNGNLGIEIIHNTVNMSQHPTVQVNGGSFSTVLFFNANVRGIISRNNLFSNRLGRFAAATPVSNAYVLAYGANANPFTESQSNVYFSGGNVNFTNSIVGLANTTQLFSMFELRTLTTFDQASFFGEVPFVNDSTSEMDSMFVGHIVKVAVRNNKAVVDIAGQGRDLAATVGALEIRKAFAPLKGGSTYFVNGIMSPPTESVPEVGSFNTINNLFRYINTTGVDSDQPPFDSIIVEITAGYVGEGDTLITPLMTYPRMSQNRRIVIRPSVGVSPVISSTGQTTRSQFSAYTSVIRFQGASWVTIEGSRNGGATRDITIRLPQNPTNISFVNNVNTRIIDVMGWAVPCQGIIIRNCNILGYSTTNSITTYAGIYQGGVDFTSATPVSINPIRFGNNDNQYWGNLIGAVRWGIFLRGNNNIAGGYDRRTVVRGNQIGGDVLNATNPTNYFGGANNVSGVLLISQAQAVIDNNTIKNNLQGFSGNSGIEISSPNIPTPPQQFNSDSAITVTRNYIYNIRSTSTSAYGINVNLRWDGRKSINVFNNMISGISATGAAPAGAGFINNPIGILLNGSTPPTPLVTETDIDLNIWNNSINLGPASTMNNGYSACLAVGAQTAGSIRVQNNLFQNRLGRTTNTGTNYALAIAATADPFLITENNNYFVSAVNGVNAIGGSGIASTTTNYLNLNTWSAFSLQDTLSMSFAVPFTNDTTLLIPISTPTPFYRAGSRLPLVSHDILGIPRPTLAAGIATMGAHEYIGSYQDLVPPKIYDYTLPPEVCFFSSPILIRARIIDRSTTILDTMYYRINGGPEVAVQAIVKQGMDRVYEIPQQPDNTRIAYRFSGQDGAGLNATFINADPRSGYNYTTTIMAVNQNQFIATGFDLPNENAWYSEIINDGITKPATWNLNSFGSTANPVLAPLTGARAALFSAPDSAGARLVSTCLDLTTAKRPTLRMYLSQNADNLNRGDSIMVRISPGFGIWTNIAKGYVIRRPNASFAVPGYRVYDVCLEEYVGFSGIKVGIEAFSRAGGNIILDSVVIFDNYISLPVTPKSQINCYNDSVRVTIANADSKFEYTMFDMLTQRFVGPTTTGTDANMTLLGYMSDVDSAYMRVFVRNLTSNCTHFMDDTAIVFFRNYKGGPFIVRGTQFDGRYNTGDIFTPDAIEVGGTADFQIVPPQGTTNASYGTNWTIASFNMYRYFYDPNTGLVSIIDSARNFNLITPTSSNPGAIRVVGMPIDSNKTFELRVTFRLLPQGCDSTVVRVITVANPPRADFFVPNDTLCADINYQFANFSTTGSATLPMIYNWDFGDGTISAAGSPVKSYSTPGTYRVRLITRNNTTLLDSISTTITVLPSPTASFTHTLACEGKVTRFTSTGPHQAGNFYQFNIGGQVADSSVVDVIIPGYDTIINVRLLVRNNVGCFDTTVVPVQVFAQPTADFNADNVCAGAGVMFNNASSIKPGKNGRVNSFGSEWTFGNGDKGFSNSPAYFYPAGGTYFVSLKVISNYGCIDTISKNVTVYNKPDVDFTLDNACRLSNLVIDNKTTFAGNSNNLTYRWDFGDNSGALTSRVPVKAYGATGTFFAKLVVADTVNNCVDSAIVPVTVKRSATAGFDAPAGGCVNQGVEFRNTSIVPPQTTPTFTYLFGDGNTSSNPNPTHQYPSGGNKTVRLIVDIDGCRDTATRSVNISAPQTIDFIADSIAPTTYRYTASRQNLNLYTWNFGDNSPIVNTKNHIVTHIFDKKGTYNVTLTVQDENGCSASNTEPTEVKTTVGFGDPALVAKYNFNVYPNPFTKVTNVAFDLENAQDVVVEVYDLLGRSVYTKSMANVSAGGVIVELDEANFNAKSSAYIVRVKLAEGYITAQIIKN